MNIQCFYFSASYFTYLLQIKYFPETKETPLKTETKLDQVGAS